MTKRREPYAKLYASWHTHPRTGPLSLAASGLEARMLSWVVMHGTNGRVPRESLGAVTNGAPAKDVARALAELLKRGVVTEEGDVLVIREYLSANISKERDDERRANAVERQDRSRGAPERPRVTRDKPTTGSAVTRDGSTCHTPSLDHDHDLDHDHLDRGGNSDQVARAPTHAPEEQPAGRLERLIELVRKAGDRGFRSTGETPPPWFGHLAAATWGEIADYLEREHGPAAEAFAEIFGANFAKNERAKSKGYAAWLVTGRNGSLPEFLGSTRTEPEGPGLQRLLDDVPLNRSKGRSKP